MIGPVVGSAPWHVRQENEFGASLPRIGQAADNFIELPLRG